MLDVFCQEEDMEHDPTASRNRDPSEPDNNMNVDEEIAPQVGGDDDNEEMGEDDAFDEEDELNPQEFSALNSQLDQLQSALDSLETRNDDIHSKLLDLLRSSREIRQEMSQENNGQQHQHQQAPPLDGGAGASDSVAQNDKGNPSGDIVENIPAKKSDNE